MKITIKILEQGREMSARVFGEGVYRVGRSQFSDIVLSSETISRSHLEIRVTESSIYITNMGNAGKVKINGKAVETAEVNDGDEIAIGPYRLIVMEGEHSIRNADAGADNLPAGEEPVGPDEIAEGEDNFARNNLQDIPSSEPDLNGGFDGNAVPAMEESPEPQYDASEKGSSMFRSETQVELKPLVAKLIFTEGVKKDEEFFLEAYEVTMGRSKTADIFVDDPKLSRVHVKITRVGMGYRLIDLNSRNGTYVNGLRILEHPLSSFDEIQIGNTKFKFLIHDIISADAAKGGMLAMTEQTKSVALQAVDPGVLLPSEPPVGGGFDPAIGLGTYEELNQPKPKMLFGRIPLTKRNRLLMVASVALILVLVMLPSSPTKKTEANPTPVEMKIPPNMPKEYGDLSPEGQRAIEGHYNSALRAAEREQLEESVAHLRKIHETLPYYKESRELQDRFVKKLKEKQILEAQEKARRDEKQDLALYLEDGLYYLKLGEFDRAAEAFNAAVLIDPNNGTAMKGLRAAELRLKDIDSVPPDRDPELEKKKQVADLFQKSILAFTNKSYQEAIDTAEQIRLIELKGDTQYLNEAKQIIDRSRMLQKEEFEPFLLQAREEFAQGNYGASRDLCEEMLKRDGAYEEAKDCAFKARKQLNRLAKEAYTHGYILESMNKIEEAKQYWNRAKNYVRSGDEYFDKVMKKLDTYQ